MVEGSEVWADAGRAPEGSKVVVCELAMCELARASVARSLTSELAA